MWAPNVRELSAECRTFAVDQIGEIGKSICTRPIRSFEDLLIWMDELFDGLGLGVGINLAGLSYGGALAAQYAVHFPQRLNKLVLLAPGNTILRIKAWTLLRLLMAAAARRTCLPPLVRWMFADMVRKDPEWAGETTEMLSTTMGSGQRRNLPFPPVLTDREWGSLKVPVLFLVGEHEVIYSAKKAVSRLKRVAPWATAAILPGAGHDLTFVQAAEVDRRILDFLKSAGAVAAH